MKKALPFFGWILLFGVALFTIQSFALKEIPVSGTDIEVGDFKTLGLTGPFDVYYTQGPVQSVHIEAKGDDVEKIEIKKSENDLMIGLKKGEKWNGGDVKIYVYGPSLEEVNIAGSGDFYSDMIKQDKMVHLSIAGSGDIKAGVIAPKLHAEIAGSGDMNLNGKVEKTEVRIAGTGDFDARALISEDVSVKIAGTGDATVYAGGEIEASISGTGDVYYLGEPDHVEGNVSGTGSIKPYK